MGCTITQSEDLSITLSQDQELAAIDPSDLLDGVERKYEGPATAREATAYRRTIGRMLYIGRLAAPLVLYHASTAASKQSNLSRHHLRSLASILVHLHLQGATFHFLSCSHLENNERLFILDAIGDGATTPLG